MSPAFADQPFIASHYFTFTEPYEGNASRLGIDYVILDTARTGTCAWCAPYPEEVTVYLEEHAELVAEVEGPGFVSQVYHMPG